MKSYDSLKRNLRTSSRVEEGRRIDPRRRQDLLDLSSSRLSNANTSREDWTNMFDQFRRGEERHRTTQRLQQLVAILRYVDWYTRHEKSVLDSPRILRVRALLNRSEGDSLESSTVCGEGNG